MAVGVARGPAVEGPMPGRLDFRTNLIVDRNNPILVLKAWRDYDKRGCANPLAPNELTYLANGGDVVCVSNFESALLDLPIKSSSANAALIFEADTERIPPVGTKVTVIFEPVPEKK